MSDQDPDVDARRLSARALERDDATGWFEELYAEAARGAAVVPWDVNQYQRLVAEWVRRHGDGGGRTAVVVGCGTGQDAELVASLGYETTAFDIAPSAVSAARQRYPGSLVEYAVANLLELPATWQRGFDLVVESLTVQSLPLTLRVQAIAGVASLVGAGGTLLVVSGARPGPADATFLEAGPPWPLDRAEVESFADPGETQPLEVDAVEFITDPASPNVRRWRAVFTRGGRSRH